MSQQETRFKAHVQKRLKDYPDIWVVKVQQVTIRGTPDLLLCVRGRFVAWELKTDHGVLSALQAHNIDLITKAGGVARVVTPSSLDHHIEELACLGYSESPQRVKHLLSHLKK